MAYGVTPEGFVLKRLYDIISDINTRLASVRDPITDEALTPNMEDVNDPLIQVIQATADGLSLAWENLQLAYNQFDPLKATAEGLSGLVQLNGIRRIPAAKSTVTLDVHFTSTATVPKGSQVSNADGSVKFITTADVIGNTGTYSVTAECIEDGPVAALSGTLTKITTPIAGWDTVTNPLDATLGRYTETDTELRTRQQFSTENTARSMVEDIYSNLMSISGVMFVKIYVNGSTITDTHGLPTKSIGVVISGGDNTQIAKTLFRQTPLGIAYYGNTNVNVVDNQGFTYTVSFLRPVEVEIYIHIHITVVDATIWPSDGEIKIKEAIMAYVAGGAAALGIPTGFERNGFLPGESVYAGELYTPTNSVPGIRVTLLEVGITTPGAVASVVIDWDEIAVFDSSRITFTVS